MCNPREVHISLSNPLQECSMEELTEWARKEKLGSKFQSKLEQLVRLGGLRVVTDKYLLDLGIMLPALRKKILEAIKRKLIGNRKVRFGEVLKFEPILNKKPSTKCPWVELDEIEVRHDTATWQAAIRTWRFCATGVDGLEDISLMRDVFNAWKSTPKGIFQKLQDMLEDIGAFFVSMPWRRLWSEVLPGSLWPMLMRGSVQRLRDSYAVVGWGGA
eukprot:s714_g8.t1